MNRLNTRWRAGSELASPARAAVRALLLASLILLSPTTNAQDNLELKVKAAFLFNLGKFVAWPPQKFAAENDAIDLCVFYDDSLGPVLEQTLLGKTINGRPLAVRRLTDEGNWGGCHLAYLGAPPAMRLTAMLERMAGRSVLTVHENSDALANGVVRLYLEERKLRFEINSGAAQREQLVLSSKLMSLASVVQK